MERPVSGRSNIAAVLDTVARACHPLRADVAEAAPGVHEWEVEEVMFPFAELSAYGALLEYSGTLGWCGGLMQWTRSLSGRG